METAASTRTTVLILGGGLLIGLAIGGVVFFGLPALGTPSSAAVVTSGPAPITGAPAPDFTLADAGGKQYTLGSFKGRPVLINFWATWCGPCKIEMPAIEAAYRKHQPEQLVVLAVDAGETGPEVTAFGRSLGLSFPLLLDPGNSVNDLYRVRAYPTSFFIGPDGLVAALQIGSMNESQLAENLAKILPK